MYSPYEARYFYQLLSDCFEESRVKPAVVEYLGQIHTMLALVSSGIGVAIVPEAASRLHFAGIVLRQLHTKPAMPVQTVVSYRRDNDNPVLTILKQHLKLFVS